MKWHIIVLIVLMNMLQSFDGQDIDKTIDRIDGEDLSSLKGLFIHFRSKGHSRNKNIYFITTNETKCSPYVVEVDKSDIDNLSIKNDLVLKSCKGDYLDKQTIKVALTKYLELDVCLIQVDSFGNIYINPNKQEAPTFLKKSRESSPKDLDQFELYKEDWYIRK